MKKVFLALLLMMPFFVSAADQPVKIKTLVKAAKTAIKNKSGQEGAEKNLLDAIGREDVTDAQRAYMYFLAQELERSQNDAQNEKLYLKQAYDTVKYFTTVLNMHKNLLRCDSVETVIGKKYKYRNKGRDIMLRYRKILFNGGKFQLARQRYAEAYDFFDMYLRTPYHPIFEQNTALRADTMRVHVAYWATLSGYNANTPKLALAYLDSAVAGADIKLRPSLCEYKVRCYEALQDTAQWFKTLKESIELYPDYDYFYLHLLDYYSATVKYQQAINLCDTLMERVGDRALYWLCKSQMQLNLGEYEACIESCNHTLALDSTSLDAHYNKGVAYLNMALEFSQIACTDIRNPRCKRDRIKLNGLYSFARDPMEYVRKMLPDDVQKWAPALYKIYLNLNMGDEFAEIEQLLKDAK